MKHTGRWVIASALFALILLGIIAGLFGLDGTYSGISIFLGATGLSFVGVYAMVYRD